MGKDDDKEHRRAQFKLVSDNSGTFAQRALEENVRVSFAAMACDVLEFICDGRRGLDLDLLSDFVAVYRAAEKASIDPKGVAIRMADLGRKPANDLDPDEAINTTLRGALRMTAALLQSNGNTDDAKYREANAEISQGVSMIMAKVKKTNRRR